MVDTIAAIHTFIQTCKSAQFIYNTLMDKTVQFIDEIGSIELHAAKECLNKAKYSNNKEEEISRAITIMLMAKDKISSSREEKFQTTLLIAMCYHFINEFQLSKLYLSEAKEQFNIWLDLITPIFIYNPIPPYSAVSRIAFLSQKLIFVHKVESIGLEWRGDTSIPEWRRNSVSAERDLREGVKHAKDDFSCFVDSLFR